MLGRLLPTEGVDGLGINALSGVAVVGGQRVCVQLVEVWRTGTT